MKTYVPSGGFIYSESSTQTLYFGYRCSACRERQITTRTLASAVYYTDIGCGTSLLPRKERMQERLKKREKKKYDRFLTAYYSGAYRKLDLKDACAICGHKEPWTRFFSRTVRWLAILAALLELVALTQYFRANSIVPGWSLAVLPGLCLLGAAGYALYCRRLERKIMQMDCRALPRLLAGEEACDDFLAAGAFYS